jgi:hypothetical protein
MGMHFSRLLLIVAAALPLGACLTAAAQQEREIATSDDTACRSVGLKPGTPRYVKCREERSSLRAAQSAQVRAM